MLGECKEADPRWILDRSVTVLDGCLSELLFALRNEKHRLAARDAATADRARREGAVEALREAATAFGHMWQADPIPSASVVYAALRARADRLETP